MTAPAHLTRSTRAWWRSVAGEYDLEGHHLRLLTLAAEAYDRAQEAREAVARDGAYAADRFGALKAHPAIAVERDSRIAFARLVRELDLDGTPLPDPRPKRRA
ncbi:MAG: P27 family phage terminase small subunit [Solirubrobacteraceae bacterium]